MERATSFGRVADLYERARPGYPEAAVEWLLQGCSGRVVDLGAGTGKLTRQLVARAGSVVAVEPDAAMRDRLAVAVPAAEVLAGAAEDIPVADGSADAVLVAQAFHWFDTERALPEIARALRPGGVLGIVWNLRDDAVDWVEQLSEVLYDGADSTRALKDEPGPEPGELFEPIVRRDFRHAAPMELEQLLDLVRTRSYFIAHDPGAQAGILEKVRSLVATHPDLAGRETFEMPYVTIAYRALRLP